MKLSLLFALALASTLVAAHSSGEYEHKYGDVEPRDEYSNEVTDFISSKYYL
jgi:hypothetical protein